MKKRVADVVVETLTKNNITDVFSLVGGGSMFLNDAIGNNDKLNVVFNHHEQACSMAAEGYVRASGKLAAVCVTTGPGGTNAITGVLGAFQDNYPMIIISGQVRIPTTAYSTGLPLRFMGEQEHNIIDTVKPLTKYAITVWNPYDIKYELEKAIFLANDGRKGPCWVDIPLDVQSAVVEEENLKVFYKEENNDIWDDSVFMDELKKSKRPVILAGSALRSSGCIKKFRQLVRMYKIPVLSATYNADLMTWSQPYYYGNFGINGGRAGNFIVQNADLIIGMGCRMAFRQIGFNYESFAPNARKMIVDVDENELKKPTLKIDVPINENIVTVVEKLVNNDYDGFEDKCGWIDYCEMLKKRFPVYLQKFNNSKRVNPYYLAKLLHNYLPKDSVTVLGNSSIAGHILQMGIINDNQRIINNMNCGSMGYDIPASIGASKAIGRDVLLITGDGSVMLNLQELMTIKHYKLPIKIIICNNEGYRAIVRTQQNMFDGRYTGCTSETGVEIPDFSKIAKAFNIPYKRISNHKELDCILPEFLSMDGAAICEILQDLDQVIEPRTMSRKLEDGTLVSPVIDDLYPFLTGDEYRSMSYKER